MESVSIFQGTLMVLFLLFIRFGVPIAIMWVTNTLCCRYNDWRLSHQI